LRGLLILIMAFWAANCAAEPVRYVLEIGKSTVGFTYQFNGNPTKGTIPVASADMTIDFAKLANSTVQVALNVKKARGGFIFASEALRGKSVLDAASHPQIRFISTQVSRSGNGAKIDGMVTIRGVTKPLTLMAGFYRLKGSDPADLSRLSILLSGTISRSDFGATGYPDLVGERIDLRILARIRQLE